MAGCILPPSLEVENQDAGVNSPPAILAVRSDLQELPEPGPVSFQFGASPGTQTLNIELLDTDVLDTLYVRVFVNYRVTDPTPARSTCAASPTSTALRNVTCDLGALCQMNDITSSRLDMSVVVFDREPLESGSPMFQAMPEGGLSASKFYYLTCRS
ncbi:MAG: hypothetical protein ACTHU0_11440 [Kofleriaceae bacterium]